MNWNDQATMMMNAWTEGQKQLWQNWNNWVQSAPAAYADMTKPWRDMMEQSLQSWNPDASPTAKNTAQKLFANQDIWMRFFEFSTNAWKNMAPKVESGEDWAKMMADYSTQLREQLLQFPQRMFQAAQNSTNLWQLYLDQAQTLSQPWMKIMQQAPQGFASGANGTPLHELSGLYRDIYEQTFGQWLQSPTFGLTREINDKLFKAINAQHRVNQTAFDYQVIVIDTWVQAFEAWMNKLVSLAKEGKTINTLRELITLWNEVAEGVFLNVFNSEKYIRVQGDFLNAQMAYRIQKREVVELLLQMNDLPTRNEVDEAHRHIYEQNKEIKALKKTVAAYQREMEETHQTINALRQEVQELADVIIKKTSRKRKSASKQTTAEAAE